MKKIFLSAAVIGLLASCSQTEGLSVDNSTADSRQIQLSVGVGDLQTRAGYNSENLEQFQLIIDNPGNAEYNYNILMQKGDDGWNTSSGEALMWDSNTPNITVCAFAPAKDDVQLTNGNLEVKVPSNQSTEDALKTADFLLAKKAVNLQNENGKLDIKLKHKLCKLIIKPVSGGVAATVDNLKANGVILSGTCDLTTATPAVVATSAAGTASITPFKNAEGAYECILLPQNAGTLTVTFNIGDTDYEWKSDEAQLTEGTCYTLTMDVVTSESNLEAIK